MSNDNTHCKMNMRKIIENIKVYHLFCIFECRLLCCRSRYPCQKFHTKLILALLINTNLSFKRFSRENGHYTSLNSTFGITLVHFSLLYSFSKVFSTGKFCARIWDIFSRISVFGFK